MKNATTEEVNASLEKLEQLGRFAQPAVLGALILQLKTELDRLQLFVKGFCEPEVPAAVTAATNCLAEAMGDVAGESRLARESLTATVELLRQAVALLDALPATLDGVVSAAVAREVEKALGVRH